MSRTAKWKIQYFVFLILAAMVGIPLFVFIYHVFGFIPAILLFLPLLIPGRISMFRAREIVQATRLMKIGQFEAAIEQLNAYLHRLEDHPQLEPIGFLSGRLYTNSRRAMALFNMGVCYLEKGELETAKGYFKHAIEIDELYPKPYVNLAIIALIHDDQEGFDANYNQAVELGFTGQTSDQLVSACQA